MSGTTESKTCLLLIPKNFYSFEKHISNALRAKGFVVTVANDEYPEGTLGKLMGKLKIPLLPAITRKKIVADFLEGKQYDIALIFKGRGVSEGLIKEMAKCVKKIIGYNWDSFKYNSAPLKWYKSVDKYYTFDYNDADHYGIDALELFTSSAESAPPEKEIKYELSYIVRNHSERLSYIGAILNVLEPKDVFIYIYIYEMNVFTFLINFFKNPRLYLKLKKYIFFKPLNYSEYTDAIKSSLFTIDYAHSDQSGITMRCYEAIKMGTRLITNNKFISRSEYFNSSNTVVYNLNEQPSKLINGMEACKKTLLLAKTRDINDFIEDITKI